RGRQIARRRYAMVARTSDDLAQQLRPDAGIDLQLIDQGGELVHRGAAVARLHHDPAHPRRPYRRRAVDERAADTEARPGPRAVRRASAEGPAAVEDASGGACRGRSRGQVQRTVVVRVDPEMHRRVDQAGKDGHAARIDRLLEGAVAESAVWSDFRDNTV